MKIHVLIAVLTISAASVGPTDGAEGPIPDSRAPSAAVPRDGIVMADQARSLKPRKPLETVLDAIKQVLPGRALDARIVERSGRQAYEIRWMGDNGKVSDITADALSGEIVDKR